jgi:hypothetical protein
MGEPVNLVEARPSVRGLHVGPQPYQRARPAKTYASVRPALDGGASKPWSGRPNG